MTKINCATKSNAQNHVGLLELELRVESQSAEAESRISMKGVDKDKQMILDHCNVIPLFDTETLRN